jgi:hypothetical protein
MRRALLTALLVTTGAISLAFGADLASAEPFAVGAAVSDYTPPAFGGIPNDPANCLPVDPGVYTGPRAFSFMEPYADENSNGHYDLGERYLDCNANERWDGNFIGGGSNTPRFYTHVLDPVTARAFVVSNGEQKIAVEVLDHEGLFNVYMERIRAKVAADGYQLDGIFISSTHDESAPDSLGLYGVNDPADIGAPAASSVNDYWNDYLVNKSAEAIEHAYDAMEPATIRYSVAEEPANMRQCWSSYPFVDDMRMPVLQAVDSTGNAIVTLGNVSQHTETLGFNSDPSEKVGISADWPHFFRNRLEDTYGGVAIEMAGSVGSVESPQVFSDPISRVPEQFVSASHPAGCRTTFNANGTTPPLGYHQETQAYGEQLAAAVEQALGSAQTSQSNELWGERRDICVPLTNTLFAAIAHAGIFAKRPGYSDNCTVESPVAPNGTTSGTEVKSQVAAFQIGDGEFISMPGEVFPFTFLRSFLGAGDMPHPEYGLPPWPLPHMHAPYRFLNGLGEDMIGYIFPRGNGIGVPGEDPSNPTGEGDDRFGCGHSDDSESASSQAGDIVGQGLVDLLDSRGAPAERVVRGRYVLPDGTLSRDPLGGPVIKCAVDQTYQPSGPATAVFVPGEGAFAPSAWMALDGRPQSEPNRDTRGYFDGAGNRVWLDVFPDVPEQPSFVRPKAASPFRVPLVPAYAACSSPNRTHGPPLAFGSCSPPQQTSSRLTVGTPDANGSAANSVGFARFDVMPGDPGTTADEADVTLTVSITDVRRRSDLSDYTGDLEETTSVRLTDRANGPGADEPATLEDAAFGVAVPCAATAATGVGATCSISTSIDAVMPGAAPEGARSVWQLGSVEVFDGGPDDDAATAPNTLFARQGVFVP